MTLKDIDFSVAMYGTTPIIQSNYDVAYTGDESSINLRFAVTDEPDLEGATAIVHLKFADSSHIERALELTESVFSYTLKGTENKHAGVVRADIIITKGGAKFTRAGHKFKIDTSLDASVPLVEFSVDTLDTLVDGAEEWLLQAQIDFGTAQSQRAEEWVADNDARADEFAESQTDRTNAFDASEAARTTDFNASETGRSNTFTVNENAREAAAESGEAARYESFELSEYERTTTFGESEAGRVITFNGSEAGRTIAFNLAEEARSEGYANDHDRAGTDHTRAENDHDIALTDQENYVTLLTDLQETINDANENIAEFDVALQNGIVATNIAAELQNLEETYAPDLFTVKKQLAAKAEQSALNAEKARIDSFTTLASGSTTGDAELIDGRLGADGITYSNIGGAIRGQVDKLKNNLSAQKSESEIAFIDGYYIRDNFAVGAIVPIDDAINYRTANAAYAYAILDVEKIKTVTINGGGGANPKLWCFLDSVYKIISVSADNLAATNLTLEPPLNAKYLIINNSFKTQKSYFAIDNIRKKSYGNPRHIVIASSTSSYEERNCADYICDGIHDEITISQAINSLTYGGVVEFCDGVYELQGLTTTEFGIGYAIFVANTGYDRIIKIIGRTQNKWYFSGYGCTFHFDTSALDVSGVYSIIGASGTKISDTLHTWARGMANIEIENINIKTSEFTKKVVGIDLRHFGSATLTNIVVENDNSTEERYNGASPSVPVDGMIGVYGLYPAQTLNAIFKNVIVNSFFEGFKLNGGEHNILLACAACRCVYGYTFDDLHKTVCLIECADEGNTYLPRFLGSGCATIINHDIEGMTYPIVNESITERYASEETAGNWSGDISFRIQGGSFGTSGNHFFKNGHGKNFKVKNLIVPLSGATLPISKEYLMQFFDTTTNKMLIWNGLNWVDGSGAIIS